MQIICRLNWIGKNTYQIKISEKKTPTNIKYNYLIFELKEATHRFKEEATQVVNKLWEDKINEFRGSRKMRSR